eukprot:gene6152-biopygen2840
MAPPDAGPETLECSVGFPLLFPLEALLSLVALAPASPICARHLPPLRGPNHAGVPRRARRAWPASGKHQPCPTRPPRVAQRAVRDDAQREETTLPASGPRVFYLSAWPCVRSASGLLPLFPWQGERPRACTHRPALALAPAPAPALAPALALRWRRCWRWCCNGASAGAGGAGAERPFAGRGGGGTPALWPPAPADRPITTSPHESACKARIMAQTGVYMCA